MTITIRDVARAAGVSVATVSRVLNGSGPASAAARSRIQAAARELRYSPNAAARTLSTRVTRTIGVLLPDLHGEYFSEVIRGADQEAQRQGFHLLVSNSHDDRAELEAAMRAMRGRIDGLVVMWPDADPPGLADNVSDALPVVLVNSPVEAAAGAHTVETIGVDNYGGAYAMVRHLASLGHRRIALLAGGSRNLDARERRRGYRAALRDADLPIEASLEQKGDFSEAAGYRLGAALVQLAPRPTALFAANDAMAIGALAALHEAGVHVPRDMAIGGFDDIPVARYMSPPLTTVHVDNAALGARAVSRLIESARGHDGVARETLPATLVVRASCGAGRDTRRPRRHGRAAAPH